MKETALAGAVVLFCVLFPMGRAVPADEAYTIGGNISASSTFFCSTVAESGKVNALPAPPARKTEGFMDAATELVIGLLVLGVILSLIGGYVGLNMLVLWSFVGTAVMSEVIQMLLRQAGLGFGMYGFYVTFTLGVGAAIMVMMKTGG